jgi:UDP-glucose:(heptosyl)LPS alpha-1,3-glucosyltransferase
MADDLPQLKIAIVLDKFLPSRGGERYFSSLAEELVRRGHDVHIFASKTETSGREPYRVHLVPVVPVPRSLRMLSFSRNADRMVEAGGFDVVHGLGHSLFVNVLNPHGGVERAYLKQEFASIASRPYYWFRLLRRYLSVRHYLELRMQKALYSQGNVTMVIAISRMIKRDITDHFGFPGDRIAVVFNSVDLERFHPSNRERFRDEMRARLGLPPETVVLLFAGNNYRLKGVRTLIHAVRKLKDELPDVRFTLLIAGRGRVGPYRRLARRLGVSDEVRFLGPVTGMERYYAASDIYVHPTFYDSCSLTVLEALASGLPAITTRFNGASDAMLSEDGGVIVEDPADADELARAIGRFADAGKRDRARSLARRWMEAFPPSRNVDETLAVYYQAAREGERPFTSSTT